MLRPGIAGRFAGTTVWAAAVALWGAAPAFAQLAAPAQPARPGINVATAQPSPEPPAPEAAMRAFQAVASWVRDWKASPAEGLPAAAGAYVTLRLDGQIVGRGMALSENTTGDAGCISRAGEQALEEARRRAPIERDALFEDNLRGLSPRIAITLELAGALVPFAPKEYAQAAAEVGAGIEGVAVRSGERTAAMFPEQMLVSGTDPGAALSALASRLAEDPAAGLKKPSELAAERGFVFYRFRTTTIAQPKAGAGPEFLQRGGRLAPRSDVAEVELRTWAHLLAHHLIDRCRSSGGTQAPAVLDPVKDLSDQGQGDAAFALLASLALERFSCQSSVGETDSREAREISGDILKAVLERAGPEVAASPIQAAVALIRLSEEGPDFRSGTRANVENWMEGAQATVRGVSAGIMERGDVADRASMGLVTLAIVVSKGDPSTSRSLVRRVFQLAGAAELTSQLPWIGWADLILSGKEDVPSATALREMRSLVWQHQLRAEDLPAGQQDLAGGIVFTASTRGQPLPTWQAARPLAFIATMLGDERLTEEKEVPAELSRLLASLRFLRQLTAGEAEGHMYANPSLAMGGVRASPFDQRMPPEATALTLMTVCETLQSLERLRKRQAAADAPAHK